MEPVQNSKPRRKRTDLSVKKLRSAITNGSCVLLAVDHRTAPMRRLRDLIMLHESDLGGADFISAAERSLVRRASVIELQLELLEHRFAEAGGEATASQLMDYQRATGALRRILESLGLQRRPRDVTPSLDQVISEEIAAREAQGATIDG
jgi:hypothetical protein